MEKRPVPKPGRADIAIAVLGIVAVGVCFYLLATQNNAAVRIGAVAITLAIFFYSRQRTRNRNRARDRS